MSKKRKNNTGIPDLKLDSLARMLLPMVREFYASEEGRKEYERWKMEREKNKLTKDKEQAFLSQKITKTH